MIDSVIFDLGGVLVDWDPRHLYRRLLTDEAEVERMAGEICPLSWHRRLDAGTTFAAAIEERAAEFPAYADLIRAYDSGWPLMFRGEIAGSVALLKALAAQGMPLYAITNFPAERWEEFCAAYPFTAVFRGAIVSGREGITKPDPRIYRLAMDRFGVIPSRTLFIDDRDENVAAAAALGFRTHHFQDPERLAAALNALQIL